jgi:hypothetical protein
MQAPSPPPPDSRDPTAEPPPQDADAVTVERAVCHVLFAHDVGLAINLDEAERRITATKQRQTIKHKRRAPHYFEFDPPPLRVTYPIEAISVGGFHTADTIDVILYEFGAASVAFRIPFQGPITALLRVSDELYDNPDLLRASRRYLGELLDVVRPAVAKPRLSELVEDYTIFQVSALRPPDTPHAVLAAHPDRIAGILRAEREPLAPQETAETLAARIAYGSDDVLIVDWNAAIVFDDPAEDVRAVLEYANVELLEMRYLDDQLDKALDESHEVLARRRTWRGGAASYATDLRRVAELQVDSAVLFEGVNNALKLLGDQYLARVYRIASGRFHVHDWDASILRKIQTLESIYEKLADQHAHWRMEVLEWIIIILIAVSILVSLLPGVTGH